MKNSRYLHLSLLDIGCEMLGCLQQKGSDMKKMYLELEPGGISMGWLSCLLTLRLMK